MELKAGELTQLKRFYPNAGGWRTSSRGFWDVLIDLAGYILFVLVYRFTEGGEWHIVFVAILGYYLYNRHNYRKKREEDIINNTRELKSTDFRKEQKKIREVAESMGIKQKVRIFYEKNSHFLPNILESKKNEVWLILPRNFFTLFKFHRNRFEAIIAHEFSHVKQRDTHLWWDERRYMEAFIFLSIASISFVINKGFNPFATVSGIMLGIYFFVFQPLLKHKRFRSEYKADLASVIYTGHTGILEVLKAGYIRNEESQLHPSISNRIDAINKAIDKVSGQ